MSVWPEPGKASLVDRQYSASVVRSLRLKMRLSQENLAHNSGMHRTYIGSLEAGERNPSLENICPPRTGT